MKLSSVGMSLHLLLVANGMIFLIYEDNNLWHDPVLLSETIKPFFTQIENLDLFPNYQVENGRVTSVPRRS